MNVKKKRFLVLGGGKSGLSAVHFLRERGARVDLYDDSSEYKKVYDEMVSVGLFLGQQPNIKEKQYDYAIISPGIPLDHPMAMALAEENIPILGELELAAGFLKGEIIGITGTNGKTTTTTLIGEILKNAGKRVFVGGNIGTPLLNALGEEYDYFVVEMSSFQLETIYKLEAKVSLYLNLTPDHLNRHGDMEGYFKAKANLAKCQSKDGYTVINYNDPYFSNLEKITKAKAIYFSPTEMLYEGTFLEDQTICYRYDSGEGLVKEKIMAREEIRLLGPHNLENCLGAITVAKLLGIDTPVIKNTLKQFRGVEHRMEKVCTIKGVTYINDSKATNPDSVLKALASYGDTPLILIAGGRNKGSDFNALSAVIKERVKYTVFMGECGKEMADSAEQCGVTRFTLVDTMEEAVLAGTKASCKGDIVLLSPANASFDQFNNFEQRGEVFKDIVLKLRRNPHGGNEKDEKTT